MWTLAIDTSGESGSVALGDGNSVFSAEMAARSYSSQLVQTADTLFRQAGISLSDLSLLGVVSGPGSFTGIRVGLSVAKAWAETTTAKLIAISRLALCAASLSEHAEVQVALDAGRNELFYGCYRAHGAIAIREALIKKEELLQMKPDAPLFLFEPGLAQALSRLNPSMHRLPAAIDALTFAIRAAEAGEFADPLTLDANYLRRSDAELFSKPKTTQAIRH